MLGKQGGSRIHLTHGGMHARVADCWDRGHAGICKMDMINGGMRARVADSWGSRACWYMQHGSACWDMIDRAMTHRSRGTDHCSRLVRGMLEFCKSCTGCDI